MSVIDTSISVIIPTFNRLSLLRRTIDSVLAQTHPPDEVIVIDDGSTDETPKIIPGEYPEVQYIHQPNCGISAARNRGIREATGTWLAFLDSDDEWLPNKISRQMSALKKHPDMKICHTDEIWIRNGRRVNPKKKHTKYGGWIFQKCLPLCCISPSSVIIHRSVFDVVGLFDESLPACEDYDMWLRVTAKYPVLYLDEKLVVKYGGHEDQLSQKYWGMDRFRIRAIEKILASGMLGQEGEIAAKDMLEEKLKILIQGARKRGKRHEAKSYEERYGNLVRRQDFAVHK